MEYGCGQCMPCRISRRRLWACRLMLELKVHQAAFFCTLTYRDECLPKEFSYKGVDYAAGSVVPTHLQSFLKLYRWHCGGVRIRFYGVGEYGERRGRPHYHVALFGGDRTAMIEAFGVTQSYTSTRFESRVWEHGHVDLRNLSWDLAWYIAGYICKRYTRKGGSVAEKWLAGRYPEFARMSLRPGIGAAAMLDVAEAINTKEGVKYVVESGDVPAVVRLQGRNLPLGRYLSRRLREECGYPPEVPEAVIRKKASELVVELETQSLRDARESRRVQHNRNAEARNRINNSRREIE